MHEADLLGPNTRACRSRRSRRTSRRRRRRPLSLLLPPARAQGSTSLRLRRRHSQRSGGGGGAGRQGETDLAEGVVRAADLLKLLCGVRAVVLVWVPLQGQLLVRAPDLVVWRALQGEPQLLQRLSARHPHGATPWWFTQALLVCAQRIARLDSRLRQVRCLLQRARRDERKLPLTSLSRDAAGSMLAEPRVSKVPVSVAGALIRRGLTRTPVLLPVASARLDGCLVIVGGGKIRKDTL